MGKSGEIEEKKTSIKHGKTISSLEQKEREATRRKKTGPLNNKRGQRHEWHPQTPGTSRKPGKGSTGEGKSLKLEKLGEKEVD